MPLIPLGQITNPQTKEKFVVALPPDKLAAYKRGEWGVEKLLLIPPSAIRYVPSPKDWNRVIDDYFELRSTGREPDRIYVANHKPEGQGTELETGPLNSERVFGKGNVEQSLKELRRQVPESILNLDLNSKRESSSSGPCSSIGKLSAP